MREQSATMKRIEPGLYRRAVGTEKVGSYFALYSYKGNRVQETLSTTDLGEARRLLRVRRNEDEQLAAGSRSLTLAAAANQWLSTRASGAAATIKNDRLFVRRIKEEWPGGASVLVRKIKPTEVLSFISNLKKLGKGKLEVSNSYRNHFAWALRGVFALAVADGVIANNPITTFEGKGNPDTIKLTPTIEEFRAIVKAIRSQPFSDTAGASGDLVEFMGLAGIGTAECAALQWQDVDLAKRQIHLLRRKTGKAFSIMIYPQLRPLIEKLKAAAKDLDPADPVFAVKDPKKAISTACRDLKLPKYSARSFRRMFITRALELGVDVGVVARTQGHRDGGVLILRTYRHIRPKYENEMLERLA